MIENKVVSTSRYLDQMEAVSMNPNHLQKNICSKVLQDSLQ